MEEIKSELLLSEKQRKNKKIGAKILLISLALIGLSLFVINFIHVTHKVDVNQNNIQSITLYQNGATSTELWKDTDETLFNKTISKFNSSYSKENLAFALFSGKLFHKEEIDYEFNTNVISNIAKKTNTESKYILFSYATEQQIMLNGEAYTSNDKSSISKKYMKVLIEVQNTQNLSEAKIYYINSSGNSNFYVTVNSTGEELYKFISNVFEQ